jgi:hypothetical protein
MIAKAAIRELGQALGVPTFIRLGGNKIVSSQKVETGEAHDNSERSSEGDM